MGDAQQEITGVEVEFLGCNIQPLGLGLASLGRPGVFAAPVCVWHANLLVDTAIAVPSMRIQVQ